MTTKRFASGEEFIFNTLRIVIDLLEKLRLVLELLMALVPHDQDFKDAIFISVNLDQSKL